MLRIVILPSGSFTVRMKFVADDISGMKVKVDMGERSVWIEEFKLGTDGRYVASFDSFDATQMSQSIKATVYDADGNVASLTLTYSVESYAANKANDASVGSLVKAMMKYGDSAAAYREALGN